LTVFARLGALFGVMFVFALVTTRFLPPSSAVLGSGIAPLTQVIQTAALNVRRAIEAIVIRRVLVEENTDLRKKLSILETTNLSLERENARLQRATQIRKAQTPAIVKIAPIVRYEATPSGVNLTIGAGARDGVTQKMPITTPEGLVGEVSEVLERTSLVRTLIDPDFTVSVTIAGKSGQKSGKALARGTGSANFLRAEGFRGVTPKVGDVVVTLNAPGGAFQTVPVGVIERVLPPSGNTPSQIAIVRPRVDLSDLEEVYVVRLP
jgi:rod shape-determining protein MreC